MAPSPPSSGSNLSPTNPALVKAVQDRVDALRAAEAALTADLQRHLQGEVGSGKSTAARTFTAWAHRSGLLATDPGQRLASPKPHRDLPDVLRADEAESLIRSADVALSMATCNRVRPPPLRRRRPILRRSKTSRLS